MNTVWKCLIPLLVVVGLLPFIIYRPGPADCWSPYCFDLRPKVFRRGKYVVATGQTKEHVNPTRAVSAHKLPIGIEDDQLMSGETSNDLLKKLISMKIELRSFMSKLQYPWITNTEKQREGTREQDFEHHSMPTIGVPKNMHCLTLKLREEYFSNYKVRGLLFSPHDTYRLFNKSYHHVAILSDNVIATRVAVVSAIKATSHPEKLVFHVVTDSKTFIPMHTWFALNPVWPAMLEVKALHHFYFTESIVTGIIEMMESHYAIQLNLYKKYATNIPLKPWMDAFRPSHVSLLNHLRIYLPELFPELDKIVFLDHDVVVQKDLSPLWSLDLDDRVIGAVQFDSAEQPVINYELEGSSNEQDGNSDEIGVINTCAGDVFGDYLNFSNPIMEFAQLSPYQCAWLYGMNIFDLDAWRSNNITQNYHEWLGLNKYMDNVLWTIGALPPALIAFGDHVYPLDSSWHLAGLGETTETDQRLIDAAAVLHFNGPAKPWLPISSPQFRRLWNNHINHSNTILKSCEKPMFVQ